MAGSKKSADKSIEDAFEERLLERLDSDNQDEQVGTRLLEKHYARQAQLQRALMPKLSKQQLAAFEQAKRKHRETRERQAQAGERTLTPALQAEKAAAIEMFSTRNGFYEALSEQVLPQLVRLQTPQGVGSGFFQHTNWLVSNAHVIPDAKNLSETRIIDFQGQSLRLNAELAFHRPFNKDNAPDIVIAKTGSRNASNTRGLPVDFNGDEATKKTLKFYLYFDPTQEELTPVVSFLEDDSLSEPSTYPMIYASQDGSEPPFGSSGAPILEARVALAGKTPQWQFRVLGAVYARCSSEWYASYSNKRVIAPQNLSLLCAIPVLPDFEQIRKSILIKQDEINRSIEIIKLCSNSVKFSERVRSEQLNLNRLLKEIDQNINLFKDGVTSLKIDLPEGLEKLVRSNEELLNMTEAQAQLLKSRQERETREQLVREDKKKKEEELVRLREAIAFTANPFTAKFETDHVSDQSKESLKKTQERVAANRSYGAEQGEKTSSVMRFSTKEAKKELEKMGNALKSDDLVKTPEGYQIKQGFMKTTEQSYPISSVGVHFSRPGRRKVDKDSSRAIQKAEIAPKIENGALKIHHFSKTT